MKHLLPTPRRRSKSASTPPNVLILLADQLRWDCLGCYGNRQIQTPHLDRLATQSIVFENAFCVMPTSAPARYSLLSGVYPHEHRGLTNRSTPIPAVGTFPDALKKAGYHTAAVGRLQFTPTCLDVGFERLSLAEHDPDTRYEDHYHRELMDQGLVDAVDLMAHAPGWRERMPAGYEQNFGAVANPLSPPWDVTSWIATRAQAELERWTEGGHLLLVSFSKPRPPFDPPAPWRHMYRPQNMEPLAGWQDAVAAGDLAYHEGRFAHEQLDADALGRVMAHYYGLISQIDAEVGRLLDLLEQKGLFDQTLIVFTSDHGEYLGFHHLLGRQNHMYDPLVRVPLLVKPPHAEAVDRGRRHAPLVSHVDVAATVAHAAGVSRPATMHGFNLLDPAVGRQMVFAQDRAGTYMARSERVKLLLARNAAHSRLFDLAKDPLEQRNLYQAPGSREAVRTYRAWIARWVLFDTPGPAHVDRRAPRVTASGGPTGEPGASAALSPREVRRYFENGLERVLAGHQGADAALG